MAANLEEQPRSTSLSELRAASQPPEQRMPIVHPGFGSLQSFELMQRAAKAFAASTLVPVQFQNNVPNCIIALELATRIGASPLMIAQNLYVVHGRPSWSAQFLIAAVNQCGRYTALQYEWTGTRDTDSWTCRAWTKDKSTGDRVQGPSVSIAMAKKEGWYEKNGSKWKSIPELMLMYRAATFFARTNAPELTMGLSTDDEAREIIDVQPERITTEDLRDPQPGTTTTEPESDKPRARGAKAKPDSTGGSPYNDEVHALLAIDAAKDREEANTVVDACRDLPFYPKVVEGYNKKWAEVVA